MQDLQEQIDAQVREIVEREKQIQVYAADHVVGMT